MIITDKFIFWHLPKCAGTTTRQIFNTVFGKDVLYDSQKDGLFHNKEIPKEFTEDKERDWIINFRKLPAFLLSKTNHTYREMIHNFNERIEADEAIAAYMRGHTYQRRLEITGDEVVKQYMSIFNDPKTKVIRQEHYRYDLLKVLSCYCDDIPMDRINMPLTYGQGNEVKLLKPIETTKEELQAIYEENPLWSLIQKKYYYDNN